jgi:hypothetical protein
MFPSVEPKYASGKKGKALVKGDRKTVKLKFDGESKIYSFKRTKKTAKLKPGTWYVKLTGDNDDVYSFHPWAGHYTGKVMEFVSSDGIPAPKIYDRRNKDGQPYTVTEFTVLIGILEPKKYAGVVVPFQLRYNFLEAHDEEGTSIVGLMSKGSRTAQLREFLSITGADRKPMKWRDNVLPLLEKRILRAEVEFNFIIKNGWIDSIYLAEEPEEVEDWDDEPEESTPEPADDADEIELDWEE